MWTKNQGFDLKHDIRELELQPGSIIDRYGAPDGEYIAPDGTPFNQRSLPRASAFGEYHKYVVVNPITVKAGTASSSFWFGTPGGGIQYQLLQGIKLTNQIYFQEIY